jgi:hypothetical protein
MFMDFRTMQKLGNTLDEILDQAIYNVGGTCNLPDSVFESIRVEIKTKLILELLNKYKVNYEGD